MIINSLPAQYVDTYCAAIIDKDKKLKDESEKPRIIIVGGSNVAFGINSEIIEDRTDYRCINIGLLAGLGVDFYLNMVKNNLRKGDIVVLAFEYQLLGEVNTNMDYLLETTENHFQLYSYISPRSYFSIIQSYPKYSIKKMKYFFSSANPEHGRPHYSRKNFNKNGDVNFIRDGNYLEEKFLSRNNIEINERTLSLQFVKRTLAFANFAQKEEATVCLSFPSRNERTVISSKADIDNFYSRLENEFGDILISNIQDYMLPQKYFYDTNYHLTDKGAVIRSNKIVDDLIRKGLIE